MKMTDEELGQLLSFMDYCDEFTNKIAQLHLLPQVSGPFKMFVHQVAKGSNDLATKLEKICRADCLLADAQLPVPNRFTLARAAWRKRNN